MKRWLASTGLALLMITTLLLISCAPAAAPTPAPTPRPAATTAAAPAPASSQPTQPPAAAKPADKPPAAAKPADKPASGDKIVIRTGFKTSGTYIPYWVALEKGFYKDEGLTNVDVQEGSGSPPVFASVAAGVDTFGGGLDYGLLMGAVAGGMPLKGIALLTKNTPMGFYYYRDNPIKKPQDLKGKSIVVPQGAAVSKLTPLFLKINGMKPEDAKIVQVSSAAVAATFRAKQVDVMAGFSTADYVIFKLEGMDIDILMAVDHGLNVIGNGLVTNEKSIREQPDMVRKVTKAVLRAFQYSAEHPAEAAEIGLKYFPLLKKEALTAQVIEISKLLPLDPQTKKVSGLMSKEEFERTQELLLEGGVAEKRLADVTRAFTNDFLK